MSPVLLRALKLSAGALAVKALLRQTRRMDFSNRTVIISGGSRGLGLELARCFAEEGARLALFARDSDELERAGHELETRGARLLLLPCDVRDADDVEQSVRRAVEWAGRLDVVVNNAGIIQVGPFENMTREDFENSLATHFWGPLNLLQKSIPYMTRQHSGRVINITSIGGKVAFPHLLPYCVSKFALVGLSDGIRSELARQGIRVTTVCPGLMRTGSHINASFKGQHEKEFALFAMVNALPLFSVSSSRAARQIVEACRYGDPFLMITPQARVLNLLNETFPSFMADIFKIAAALLPPPADGRPNSKQGWESRSRLAPSWLTYISDAAVERNNEDSKLRQNPAAAGRRGTPP